MRAPLSPIFPLRHLAARHLVRRIQSRTGLTQEEIGRRLGYTGSAFRRFLAPPEAATHRPTPYLLHLALERWARGLPSGGGGDMMAGKS